jgi:hypothetical protein
MGGGAVVVSIAVAGVVNSGAKNVCWNESPTSLLLGAVAELLLLWENLSTGFGCTPMSTLSVESGRE